MNCVSWRLRPPGRRSSPEMRMMSGKSAPTRSRIAWMTSRIAEEEIPSAIVGASQQNAPAGGPSYAEWGDEKVRRVVPLGSWQRCEDVADMVLFLVSRRAAQVTGQTINVDGGFVMHW